MSKIICNRLLRKLVEHEWHFLVQFDVGEWNQSEEDHRFFIIGLNKQPSLYENDLQNLLIQITEEVVQMNLQEFQQVRLVFDVFVDEFTGEYI